MAADRINLLGIGIDPLNQAGGLKRAESLIQQPGSHYVVLPYVEFIMAAQSNDAIKSALNQADLVLSNGIALNWAAAYLDGGKANLGRLITTLASIIFNPKQVHRQLPARFDSANFTWPLLELAAKHDWSIFLIGSPKQQSIEDTADHLRTAIPNLKVAGTFTGYLNDGNEPELNQRLTQSQPDIILIGIGFPRQELLMQRLKAQLDHGLMIGEGGSFDYEQFGGRLKRAPIFLRKIGLEWLWRLVLEPRRLGRQLAIPKFIWRIYRLGKTKP